MIASPTNYGRLAWSMTEYVGNPIYLLSNKRQSNSLTNALLTHLLKT